MCEREREARVELPSMAVNPPLGDFGTGETLPPLGLGGGVVGGTTLSWTRMTSTSSWVLSKSTSGPMVSNVSYSVPAGNCCN